MSVKLWAMIRAAGSTKTSAWARRLLAVVVAYFAWAIAFGLLESTLRTEGTVATFASVPAIALAAAGGLAARWIGGRGQWVSVVLIVLVVVDTTLAMVLAPSENQPAVDLVLRSIPLAALVATAMALSRLLERRL